MAAQLTALTPADIQRFERDGYVVVRQAFSPADALAMERQWWRELEGTHGIRRGDRSSWRQIPGDLKAAKRDPVQARILTARVRGVLDDLLGQSAWPPPRDWGRPLVTFPEPGAWDVPARLWHWDNPGELHLDHPRALFVASFIGPVAPHSGGTLILSGSPRLLIQQQRALPASRPREFGVRLWERFHRSHPWLMALTGQAPSPADRMAAFMDSETTVDGVPLRVAELTGEPGDMVFCHPVMVHCAAPNRGTRPRFMRIKTQILTHEGRELRDRLERPRSQPRPQTPPGGVARTGSTPGGTCRGVVCAHPGSVHDMPVSNRRAGDTCGEHLRTNGRGLIDMDFLVHSRATPAAMEAADDPELDERHWSYMDRYADALTARGPTLGADRRTWTGSIHVLNLPTQAAAREFVDHEPYHRAGAYEQHRIWRFSNLLERTMWQFAGAADEPRFFVLAPPAPHQARNRGPVPLAEIKQDLRDRLIVYGALHNLGDHASPGVALAVQAPTRRALDTLLSDGLTCLPCLRDDDDAEIHDWAFGGRR